MSLHHKSSGKGRRASWQSTRGYPTADADSWVDVVCCYSSVRVRLAIRGAIAHLGTIRSVCMPHCAFEAYIPGDEVAFTIWVIPAAYDLRLAVALDEARQEGTRLPIHRVASKAYCLEGRYIEYDGVRYIHVAQYGCGVAIRRATHQAVVIGKEPDATKTVLHVMRSVLMRYVKQQGAIVVHGSCLTRHMSGVLFVGNAGAGKTTVLLRVGREEGVQVVSNDRTVVNRCGELWEAHGWPAYVSLYKHMLPNNERRAPEQSTAGGRERKVYLVRGEVEELFGLTFAPMTPVRGVVLLKGGSPMSAHDAIWPHVFGRQDAEYRDWLQVVDVDQRLLERRVLEWCDWLTATRRLVCMEPSAISAGSIVKLGWWSSY